MHRCLIAAVFVATPLAVALGAAQARATRPAAAPAGVELASLDRAADPCVDFYRFACGGWIDAHPLPADRRNYARMNEIRDRNDLVLRRILERPGATGSLRKASDYYAACTNTAAIDAKGLAPLRPELARIAAVTDVKALPELIAHLHMTAASNPASGISASSTFPFFQMVARADPAQASRQIVWTRPQGLGLPDRDYYTKTDDRSVKLRSDYRAHVAKMLALAGATAGERRLGRRRGAAHRDGAGGREARRGGGARPEGADPRDDRRGAPGVHAVVRLEAVHRGARRAGLRPAEQLAAEGDGAVRTHPDGHAARRHQALPALAPRPLGRDDAAAGVRRCGLRVLRPRAAGTAGAAAAMAPVHEPDGRISRRRPRPGVRRRDLPPRGEGGHAGHDRVPQGGAPSRHRNRGLDERADETRGPREARRRPGSHRPPRQMA